MIELDASDFFVALRGSGHRGTVHVLSRRGRYPEACAAEADRDAILRTLRWETSAVEA